MKMTFRWYGESDSIPLSYIRQIPNMSGVVTAVYRVPVGEVWPREDIKRLKDLCDQNGLEMEVITQEQPCPVVDYTAKPFGLLEKVASQVYPGYGVVPYVMTGGTDAKFYASVCDHCLRFAPIEINSQQYASIHSFNENLHASALVPAVDFYKQVLERYCAGNL